MRQVVKEIILSLRKTPYYKNPVIFSWSFPELETTLNEQSNDNLELRDFPEDISKLNELYKELNDDMTRSARVLGRNLYFNDIGMFKRACMINYGSLFAYEFLENINEDIVCVKNKIRKINSNYKKEMKEKHKSHIIMDVSIDNMLSAFRGPLIKRVAKYFNINIKIHKSEVSQRIAIIKKTHKLNSRNKTTNIKS